MSITLKVLVFPLTRNGEVDENAGLAAEREHFKDFQVPSPPTVFDLRDIAGHPNIPTTPPHPKALGTIRLKEGAQVMCLVRRHFAHHATPLQHDS